MAGRRHRHRGAGLGQGTQRGDPRRAVRRHAVRQPARRDPRGARRRRPDPVRPAARRVPVQLLAGRGASARPVAAHHAGGVPQGPARTGRSCWTSTRWPPRRARTGSGRARPCCGPAATARRSCTCPAAAPTRAWSASSTSPSAASSRTGSPLPEAKTDVGWIDADRIYVGTDFGPGSLTSSGYPRLVKEWRRGTAAVRGGDGLRGQTRRCGGPRVPRPDGGVRAGLRRAQYRLLPQRTGGCVPAPATWCRCRCPRTPSLDVHREWLLIQTRSPVDRRRRDLPGRSRCWPPGSTRSWPATGS